SRLIDTWVFVIDLVLRWFSPPPKPESLWGPRFLARASLLLLLPVPTRDVIPPPLHLRSLTRKEEAAGGDKLIHDRDLAWLQQADVVVAEVTQPSLGVGYELGWAVALHKPVLCLFHPKSGRGEHPQPWPPFPAL
uniref:2'-deoxynucleoside 5'-phosphate N-hydrolase 1 n=1 Tax=Capra hircus TaxID=9925 RepID=A0A8C2Y0N5_CAPHI